MGESRPYAETWDAFARAEAELSCHPSVRSLELGWKVSEGRLHPELAVRVYVDRKLPLAEVPPELRIPPRVAGLPTDVITVREERFDGHDMIGGDKVTRVVWNEPGSASGTLAYIATRNADGAAVMLSNEHVFRSDLGVEPRRREVFQPDISCQALGSKCNYVGFVTDGHIRNFDWSRGGGSPAAPHFIDCAVAQVDGADFRRGVKTFPSISGSLDISASPTGPGGTPITVKKVGATTGPTEGVVVSVNSTGHERVGPFEIVDQPLTILIRCTSGVMYSETFEVPEGEAAATAAAFAALAGPGTATPLPGNRVRFDVPRFSEEGDSGSSVVTTPGGAIVGLLYGSAIFVFPAVVGGQLTQRSVPLGESRACHIGPVMARLGIRIDPSTTPSAGDAAVAGGAPAAAGSHAAALLTARLDELERQLGASRRGRALRALVREHGFEIVDLVHHRRRVAVCWHRRNGPAFAALVLAAIRDPALPIPAEHGGVALRTLLAAMYEVLLREGSPALGAALRANREWVMEWISRSDRVEGLVAALEQEPAPPSSRYAHV